MAQQFADNAITTLTAAILPGSLSATIESAVNFPSTGTFHVQIDSEIITVTAISGTTLTIERATGAVGHEAGATVAVVISATGLTNMRDDAVVVAVASAGSASTAAIAAAVDAVPCVFATELPSINTGSCSYLQFVSATVGTWTAGIRVAVLYGASAGTYTVDSSLTSLTPTGESLANGRRVLITSTNRVYSFV